MTQNNKKIVSVEEQEDIFTPSDDLQIVMQGGLPVSVIVPMEEFDRMAIIIGLAQELLDGQQFDMADGKKGSFQELVEQHVAADRAQYEADLASMFSDDEDDEDEDLEDEEEQN